jgi:hypothetical protein
LLPVKGTWQEYFGTRTALLEGVNAKLLILAALCLLLATACQDTASEPTVPLDQQFTLAPGQAASVAGASLQVRFVRVSGDSRCPADAICIQGGDAIVHLSVGDSGGAAAYELHTGDSSRSAVSHAGFRVELISLQPYPFSSRTIGPDEYRATLKVSR